MRRIEIGFADIAENIKKNKREMLIIFLSILIGGAACSYIDYRTYEQKLYIADDTVVQKVELGHLVRDETYYYRAFMELKEKSSGLDAYIQSLKQVSLSEKNMKKVSELELVAEEEQKKFAKIQEFYIGKKPIVCDDLDAARQFVRQKVEMSEVRLLDTDVRVKTYAEQEIAIWKDFLVKMGNLDLNELQKINSEMDLLLEEETDAINVLVERFNTLIADIEKEEQYEILYNPYLLRKYCDMAGMAGDLSKEDAINERKTQALVYARSIAGVDSREERFYAILTFSVMSGIAFSFLYGGLKSKKYVYEKSALEK